MAKLIQSFWFFNILGALMDIILDRRPVSPLLLTVLLIVLLHVLFVLGAWASVSRISEILLTVNSYGGNTLTLRRDFALSMREFFIAPVVALVYVGLVKHDQWFTTPIVYRHKIETLLGVFFLLTLLLAVTFGDKTFFGFAIAIACGLLLGLYLKPVLALALLLSLGVCLTLLIWLKHGDFLAVVLGLPFQNILLFCFLLGLGLRKLLAK